MWRSALLLVLAVPVFAQLPAGVTRTAFPNDGPSRDPASLVFTRDAVLWAASSTEGVLDRIRPDGAATRFDLPHWGGAYDLTVGPDQALWLATRHYIARHDPATNWMQRWTQYPDATFIETGSDGNLWFVQAPTYKNQLAAPRVVRFSPAGIELNSFPLTGSIGGAAFGSDGALWITRREGVVRSLVRIDAAGARRELPIEAPHQVPFYALGTESLFAAPGFLWVWSGDKVLRIALDGATIGSYHPSMTPAGVDPAGNLWLRERTDAGEEVGRLTPGGLLTRFGPIPQLPSGKCPHNQPVYGGFAVAPDGRVAMTDYYPLLGYRPEDPCVSERLDNAENTLTVLDPALAPILSIEPVSERVRRRAGRS